MSGDFFGLGDLKRFPRDAAEHATEYDAVKRKDSVPVNQAEQTRGLKSARCFREQSWLFSLSMRNSRQRFSGQFHFGSQREPAVVFDACDAPEIEGLAISYCFRVAAAAAQTGASG